MLNALIEVLPEKNLEIAEIYVPEELGFVKIATDRIYVIQNENGHYLCQNEDGWHFAECNPEGYYTVTDVKTGKNLNVSDASKEEGAEVITWKAGNASNEKWGFKEEGNGCKITGLDNKNYVEGNKMSQNGDVWTLIDVGEYVETERASVTKSLITDFAPKATEVVDEETGLIHLTAENLDTVQRRVRSGDTWQFENFTALNYGEGNVAEDENCVYVSLNSSGIGSRIAYTNGNFPKAATEVVFRVRTMGEVKISVTNENISNLPFVQGIIPDTKGEWKPLKLSVGNGAPLRQRMMFLAVEGE